MTTCELPPFSQPSRNRVAGRSGSLRRCGLAVAAALRRQRMPRPSLTARLMGDPPDGRSALATGGRDGVPSPASSGAGIYSVLARTPDYFEPIDLDDGAPLDLAGMPAGMCD